MPVRSPIKQNQELKNDECAIPSGAAAKTSAILTISANSAWILLHVFGKRNVSCDSSFAGSGFKSFSSWIGTCNPATSDCSIQGFGVRHVREGKQPH